ncbi:hypothetical protein GW943_02120 [Candidatus Parcubacteria bacterium]|nr:hypothetical protein [Candidatus Parcubacteria bacterium]
MSTVPTTLSESEKLKHTVYTVAIGTFLVVWVGLMIMAESVFATLLMPTAVVLLFVIFSVTRLLEAGSSVYFVPGIVFTAFLALGLLILSAFTMQWNGLVHSGDNVEYLPRFHMKPLQQEVSRAAPLTGTLTAKQMDNDAHVVREDERAWFLVTVTYEVKDPYSLSAAEWAVLKTGGLPLKELPLSFDSAPDIVVEDWLKRNLPNVTTHVRVMYVSPPIVYGEENL